MIEVSEGIYEYEFQTLIEGLTQLKIVVNDTDTEIELELPAVLVSEDGQTNDHKHVFVDGECACGEKEQVNDEPSKGGSNCPMGFVSILPMMAAATLLLIRKKR